MFVGGLRIAHAFEKNLHSGIEAGVNSDLQCRQDDATLTFLGEMFLNLTHNICIDG